MNLYRKKIDERGANISPKAIYAWGYKIGKHSLVWFNEMKKWGEIILDKFIQPRRNM